MAPFLWGYYKGAIKVKELTYLIPLILVLVWFIVIFRKSCKVDFKIDEKDIWAKRLNEKEWRGFPISEIKEVTYSKFRRLNKLVIWTNKPYDENAYIINSVENIEGLKRDLRTKLGQRFKENSSLIALLQRFLITCQVKKKKKSCDIGLCFAARLRLLT